MTTTVPLAHVRQRILDGNRVGLVRHVAHYEEFVSTQTVSRALGRIVKKGKANCMVLINLTSAEYYGPREETSKGPGLLLILLAFIVMFSL